MGRIPPGQVKGYVGLLSILTCRYFTSSLSSGNAGKQLHTTANVPTTAISGTTTGVNIKSLPLCLILMTCRNTIHVVQARGLASVRAPNVPASNAFIMDMCQPPALVSQWMNWMKEHIVLSHLLRGSFATTTAPQNADTAFHFLLLSTMDLTTARGGQVASNHRDQVCTLLTPRRTFGPTLTYDAPCPRRSHSSGILW